MTHASLEQAIDAARAPGGKPLQLAIILPTNTERANLRPLVAKMNAALSGIGGDIRWEAIYVDDNSPDGTADEARAINREDQRIRVIQRIGRRRIQHRKTGC